MNKLLFVFIIGIFLYCNPVFSGEGEIYKWTDEKGGIHYSDIPPSSGATKQQQANPTPREKASSTQQLIDIDKTPPWYKGSKPWTSISKEGREEILRTRRGYEATKEKATQPSSEVADPDSAKKGEELILAIHKEYGIDSFYATPSMFGPRMVIWLPENGWKKLSPKQKASIEAYMKSKYANWGIGVGRVSGVDILADRLEVAR